MHRGAVLGSGSLAPEDMIVPAGSVWVGSKAGSAVCVSPADVSYSRARNTITPFGRAFYGSSDEVGREKNMVGYFVIPLWGVVLYSTLWQAFCTW